MRLAGTDRGPLRTLVIALLAGAPVAALVAFGIVHGLTDWQRGSFESRARNEARSVLVAVPEDIRPSTAARLSQALQRPGRLDVVVVDAAGGVKQSDPTIGLGQVPAPVLAGHRTPAIARTTIAGESYLVAGGSIGPRPTAVFLFFSEHPLEQSRDLTVMVVAVVAAGVLLLAAGGGWALSHRRVRVLARRRSEERAYTAHVAHELRTPVGAMVTAASLVDDGELHRSPEQIRQPVEIMQTQARRLRRIVEDLLELSRLEAGTVELRPEPVDVGQVLRETIASYGWDRARVDLPESAVAHVDRQSLTRLLLNLVGNAAQHASREVRVTVRRAEDVVVVEIADDGPGLDPGLADILTSPPRPYGAEDGPAAHTRGLGLLIARAHAQLLHAPIDVDAGADSGTTVRVRLPAAPPARSRDATSAEAADTLR